MHLNQKHSSIAIFAFFAVMAAITPYSQAHGWGLSGLFFAMIAACLVVAGGGWGGAWLFHKMRERARLTGLSRDETTRFLLGAPARPTVFKNVDADSHDYDGYEDDEDNGVRYGEIVDDMPPLHSLVPYDQAYEDDEVDDNDLPDTIIEPGGLDLGPCFQPNAESFAGQTILFCGIRGSGKSNAMMDLAEELGRLQMPFCNADTEDENRPLARWVSRGVLAGSAEMVEEMHGVPNFLLVDMESAYEFGRSIVRDALQVILNLKSYEENTAAIVMGEIIDGMNDWEEEQPISQRIPAMFFLDEANKWLPQQIAESSVTDKEALYLLQKAIFGTMVRRGRKRGLGIALATQRIAELDKRALQSTWKFLFRQTEEVDINRYAAHGIDRADVPGLQTGECFVFSPSVIGFRFHFRKRHSPHMSHTPGFAQLAQHMRQVRSIDQVLHYSTSTDQQEPHTERVAGQQPQKRRDSNLTRAVQAYLDLKAAGKKYSQTAIASATRIDLWEIRKMWHALIEEVERREMEAEAEAEAEEGLDEQL